MRNAVKQLLREYMRLVLSEAPSLGQSSLSASKILGYAAEWATFEGCGGGDGFTFAIEEDRRIKPIWDATLDKAARSQFEMLYRLMVNEASSKVSEIQSTGLTLSSPRKPDEGTATEKVDVVTKDADIHVKFNDAVRLAGFQRAKAGAPASETSVVYDKVIKQFGNELEIDPRFIDKNGFLRRPGGVKGMSKMTPRQRKEADILQAEFQDARDQYRLAFTNSSKNKEVPGYREEFIALLDDAGIRKAILKDIKSQLLGASGRATVYFKYFSNGKSVRLETHQYDLRDMIVTPIPGQSTKFYQVTSKDGEKTYFQVEFRMDGGGHPPQLKVGKDLDVAV
jgi:hypothetical protein